MGKTKKTNADATAKPSPKPNGVAKTPIANSPLTTASPAASTPAVPDKAPTAKPKSAAASGEKKTVKRSPSSAKSSKPGFTTDDISLRAYFIAEKRRAKGLPGDEAHDWIEAERQLRAESSKPAKAKKSA